MAANLSWHRYVNPRVTSDADGFHASVHPASQNDVTTSIVVYWPGAPFNHHTSSIVLDEFTYPFPNVNGYRSLEVIIFTPYNGCNYLSMLGVKLNYGINKFCVFHETLKFALTCIDWVWGTVLFNELLYSLGHLLIHPPQIATVMKPISFSSKNNPVSQ